MLSGNATRQCNEWLFSCFLGYSLYKMFNFLIGMILTGQLFYRHNWTKFLFPLSYYVFWSLKKYMLNFRQFFSNKSERNIIMKKKIGPTNQTAKQWLSFSKQFLLLFNTSYIPDLSHCTITFRCRGAANRFSLGKLTKSGWIEWKW